MKASDTKYAAGLLSALANMPKVRRGMATKPSGSDMITLQIEAYEGDDDGGTGHGSSLLPAECAMLVIKATEEIIRGELQRLGIEIEEPYPGSAGG